VRQGVQFNATHYNAHKGGSPSGERSHQGSLGRCPARPGSFLGRLLACHAPPIFCSQSPRHVPICARTWLRRPDSRWLWNRSGDRLGNHQKAQRRVVDMDNFAVCRPYALKHWRRPTSIKVWNSLWDHFLLGMSLTAISPRRFPPADRIRACPRCNACCRKVTGTRKNQHRAPLSPMHDRPRDPCKLLIYNNDCFPQAELLADAMRHRPRCARTSLRIA